MNYRVLEYNCKLHGVVKNLKFKPTVTKELGEADKRHQTELIAYKVQYELWKRYDLSHKITVEWNVMNLDLCEPLTDREVCVALLQGLDIPMEITALQKYRSVDLIQRQSTTSYSRFYCFNDVDVYRPSIYPEVVSNKVMFKLDVKLYVEMKRDLELIQCLQRRYKDKLYHPEYGKWVKVAKERFECIQKSM